MQNFIVISRVHFKPEHFKFWSNFEFNQNVCSGGYLICMEYGVTCRDCVMELSLLPCWRISKASIFLLIVSWYWVAYSKHMNVWAGKFCSSFIRYCYICVYLFIIYFSLFSTSKLVNSHLLMVLNRWSFLTSEWRTNLCKYISIMSMVIGIVPDCYISNVLAMEIPQSCSKLLVWLTMDFLDENHQHLNFLI